MKQLIKQSIIDVVPTEKLEDGSKDLLSHAQKATTAAYAPYSKFHVGAAIQLENGQVVVGNNQENAAYPSGLCAERVALFAAKSNHPNIDIQEIAIAVQTNASLKQQFTPPCGACLQVMWDIQCRQKTPIKIVVQGVENQNYIAQNVEQLLPFGFEL